MPYKGSISWKGYKTFPSWEDVKLPMAVLDMTRKLSQSCGSAGFGNLATEIPSLSQLKSEMGILLILGIPSLYKIMETQAKAQDGIQAESPQELTKPVDTALYQTPTMSFGEVGFTGEQSTDGYKSAAHSVGHFADTRVLERMALLFEATWTTSSTGLLYNNDVLKALCGVSRNQVIMNQFEYFKADIELTIRLNTNQFYYGAVMATLWPTGATGARIDERSVLDPTVISASSAESVVKIWKYSYPMAWLDTAGANAGKYPVELNIDVLAPLKAANDNMPSAITIQMWARFVNVELAFPTDSVSVRKLKDKGQAQSARGGIPVKFPSKSKSRHPADDPDSGLNSVDRAISAIESVTIGDAVQEVKSLASFVTENWGAVTSALGFLFDKPDRDVCQTPIIEEGSIDLFSCDIADTNPTICTYKGRYVDPAGGRMPMTKNWTISDYARIPALRQLASVFAAQDDNITVNLIRKHPFNSSLKTPLDYAVLASHQWRGSIKVCCQFFTSSFISARFVVQYINQNQTTGYPSEYDSGLSRVINVKGDTLDTFTLPWLNRWWWNSIASGSTNAEPQIKITCASAIASTDTVASPIIYLVIWVAGGDDIQFAYPRVVQASEWSNLEAPPLRRQKKKKKKEAQSAMGELFTKTFPPIGENTFYDIDRGYSTSEMLGPITDMCKRYSPLPVVSNKEFNSLPGFRCNTLDLQYFANISSQPYTNWYAFRQTLFGQWRACFLFRSGGYRFRYYGVPSSRYVWKIQDQDSIDVTGTTYVSPHDGISRLTIPQVAYWPFGYLGSATDPDEGRPGGLSVAILSGAPTMDDTCPTYIAARDDLQFGYPILPTGMSEPVAPLEMEEK